MVSRYFEGEARQKYWSVHVEAWRQSKLTKRAYCGEHGLSVHSFDRWMKQLMDQEAVKLRAELLREERRKKRLQNYLPVKRHWKNKAAQAFWAMHVEALIWSGMSVKAYAMSHNISPYSLKNWCSAAKANEANQGLTSAAGVGSTADEKPIRRRFTEDEKSAIAEESATSKVSAAEVCRRHGIVTSMLFRWRVQFGYSAGGKVRLAPVTLKNNAGNASSQPAILHDLIKAPDGMMTVDLGDGRRVFVPESSDVDEVRRQANQTGETRC